MTHVRLFRAALIFAAVFAVAAPLAAAKQPDENSPFGKMLGVVVTPAPAPPFPVKLANGKITSIGGHTGKVVLATFWATWCPYCHQEMPKLDKLQRKLGAGLKVLPLSLDTGDAFPKIKRFYKRRGVATLPMMLDINQMNANYAFMRITPSTLIVNKKGLVVGVVKGAAPWLSKEAVAYLRGLMAE